MLCVMFVTKERLQGSNAVGLQQEGFHVIILLSWFWLQDNSWFSPRTELNCCVVVANGESWKSRERENKRRDQEGCLSLMWNLCYSSADDWLIWSLTLFCVFVYWLTGVYLWQLKRLESAFKTLLRQTSPAIEEKSTWEEVSMSC